MKQTDIIYSYQPPAAGIEAKCQVRIYQTDAGATVLLTELADNPGMSITNASEEIASSLAARFALNPIITTWIEHYPSTAWRDERRRDETFDEITYTWQGQTASAPQWRRLTIEEVERMTGATWAAGNLTDDTNRLAEDLGFEWVQDDWEEL
jgi:hypothetical protein